MLAAQQGGMLNGTGTAAGLGFYPQGVAVSPTTGDVYFTDSGTSRVGKITLSGVLTTFAGSGNSQCTNSGGVPSLQQPYGIAFNSAGDLYVADTNCCRIRHVPPAGGMSMSTLAGGSLGCGDQNGVGSAATFKNPQGVAVDTATGIIFVGDTGNHRIRMVTPGAVVTNLAGGFSSYNDGQGFYASFSAPKQLAVAANGNVVVLDAGNNRLRMVTPSGVVTTIAGGTFSGIMNGFGTVAQFSFPSGLAIDNAGRIFVADSTRLIRTLSCTPCPSSYFCSSGSPVLCPPGSYCPFSGSAPALCPAGTSNPSGSTSDSACIPCAVGSYQPSTGQAFCLACPSNTFSAPGSLICCPAGYNATPGVYQCSAAALSLASTLHQGTGFFCTSNSSCATGAACRGGYCCNSAATRMGCSACAPGTGSCATFSPGEACASNFDCASTLCLSGCCCTASAMQTPGCSACACWTNASTTPATAGICAASPSTVTPALLCNATFSLTTPTALSRVITFPAVFNAGAMPLMLLPATSPLNSLGQDIVVASPEACAAFAATPAAAQCATAQPYSLSSGTYYYLGTAAALGMVATPGCGS